jgi:Cytochrome P450
MSTVNVRWSGVGPKNPTPGAGKPRKTTNLTKLIIATITITTMISITTYLDWRALLVLPVVLVIYRLSTRDPRRNHLPPQVRGWPIINQTFLQLKDDPTSLLRQWAKEYGEIFMTKSATTTFIWLNTMESVKELFDRRSNIYSDRQAMPMALDAASGGNRITFMRYGKRWRTVRAILHKVVSPYGEVDNSF